MKNAISFLAIAWLVATAYYYVIVHNNVNWNDAIGGGLRGNNSPPSTAGNVSILQRATRKMPLSDIDIKQGPMKGTVTATRRYLVWLEEEEETKPVTLNITCTHGGCTSCPTEGCLPNDDATGCTAAFCAKSDICKRHAANCSHTVSN